QGGGGPARTNTLGKQFFESATAPLAGPCVVGADGSLTTVAGVNHANRALYHLRIRQTFEDKKRSALDAQAFSASVGITAVLDQTLVAVATGTLDPASLDPQPTHPLFTLNHYRMYDAWLALHREGRSFIRLQINYLRWGLQHAAFATPDHLAGLKALNCGVSMSGFTWLNGVPRADGLPLGPLYPQIIASSIPAGLHEDGVHIAPHNPWFAMHYAT